MQRRDYFLHIAGNFKKFSKASQDKTGHPLNRIVFQSLPSVVQSEGTSSRHYLKEKQNFEKSMHEIATDLVVGIPSRNQIMVVLFVAIWYGVHV